MVILGAVMSVRPIVRGNDGDIFQGNIGGECYPVSKQLLAFINA